MSLLILLFALTLIISFTCSLLESVMLSVTPTYIAMNSQNGSRSAGLLKRFRSNIDQPLAAILTVNTLANTLGASAIGAQVHTLFGETWVTIFSAGLAFVILFFSEIVPKTIGATFWKQLAPACSFLIMGMIVLTYPIVFAARLIYLFFGAKNLPHFSREEVIASAEISAQEGSIKRKESIIIRNLLMLDSIEVADIMTPKSVMLTLDASQTVGEYIDQRKPIRFSRIPLFDGDPTQIVGVLHRYKLMDAVAHDLYDLTLRQLSSPIHSVPENVPVSAALDQFIKRHEHLFLVVDDQGQPVGLVTLEDAIETLLGVEILDESDSIANMRQYALEQWRLKKQNPRPG